MELLQFITVKIFQAQQQVTNMFQAHRSKIYPKYPKYMQRRPCQEIFDREYTYIYRYKDDKDTENFKIFLCAIFILDPWKQQRQLHGTNTSSGASTDYLHHTAGSGGVILKLNCDTHLAKLLSTFNFKT